MFMIAESCFVSATTGRKVTRINVEYIVASLMANPFFLANLLDDLLTLYIRIRSHSFANEKMSQNGKIFDKIKIIQVKSKEVRLLWTRDTNVLFFFYL